VEHLQDPQRLVDEDDLLRGRRELAPGRVEDFEFFTAEAPEAVAPTTPDGYLLGGFTSFGHFEEDAVLNRTPAGAMTSTRLT